MTGALVTLTQNMQVGRRAWPGRRRPPQRTIDLLLFSVTVDMAGPASSILSRTNQNGLDWNSRQHGHHDPRLRRLRRGDPLLAKAGSTALYSATLTTDAAGRIRQKVETVLGGSRTYVYAYDDADRLTDVTENGVSAGHWSYDANGNRLTGTAVGDPTTTLTGTYDEQDRLISYGGAAYTFGPRGDLRSKTFSGKTTTYSYDALGALVAVALPSGDRIDYVLDSIGRRMAGGSTEPSSAPGSMTASDRLPNSMAPGLSSPGSSTERGRTFQTLCGRQASSIGSSLTREEASGSW